MSISKRVLGTVIGLLVLSFLSLVLFNSSFNDSGKDVMLSPSESDDKIFVDFTMEENITCVDKDSDGYNGSMVDGSGEEMEYNETICGPWDCADDPRDDAEECPAGLQDPETLQTKILDKLDSGDGIVHPKASLEKRFYNLEEWCYYDSDNDGIGDYASCAICRNPGNTFSKVRIFLDPEYVSKTKEYRGFRPTKITPFDDIIIRLETTSCEEDFSGELFTSSEQGELDFLVIGGDFEINENLSDGGYKVYDWKIQGWDYDGSYGGLGSPVGWGDEDVLERIIETFELRWVVLNSTGDVFLDTIQAKSFSTHVLENPFTRCLQVFGSGEHSFTNHFGESVSVGPSSRVEKSLKDFALFLDVSPYREHPEEFNGKMDLNLILGDENIEDANNVITSLLGMDLSRYLSYSSLSKYLDRHKSCYSSNAVKTFYHDLDGIYEGYSRSRKMSQDISFNEIPGVFLHETGHSFAYLADEYDGEAPSNRDEKNCRSSPSWGSFGNHIPGCIIGKKGKRPSENSLMRSHWETPFLNVVSCGYVLKRMSLCSSNEDCWEMCLNENWNTLKPEQEFCGDIPYDPQKDTCCISEEREYLEETYYDYPEREDIKTKLELTSDCRIKKKTEYRREGSKYSFASYDKGKMNYLIYYLKDGVTKYSSANFNEDGSKENIFFWDDGTTIKEKIWIDSEGNEIHHIWYNSEGEQTRSKSTYT